MPYGLDVTGTFLGGVWHPGGSILSAKLASQIRAGKDDLILDVGCGVGATSRLLAEQFGCRVVGMDISHTNTRNALHRTEKNDGLSFLSGDGQHIPVTKQTFDGAVLECVLSTFHEKHAAVGELSRVLKPGGRLGMSDVIVEGDIPGELKTPLMDLFCIGRALSVNGYQRLLEQEGFKVINVDNRKQETLDFIEQVRRELFVARLLAGVGKLKLDPRDLDYARHLITLASKAAEEERLGYAILVATNGD